MHESRTLRFATALVLCLVVSPTTHAGSTIRYPDFPPPNLDIFHTDAAPAATEAEAEAPRALIDLARALYVAVFHPRTHVEVFNVNTLETAVFEIMEDGTLEEKSELREMKHLFRCRRTGKRRKMDPGILRILADVAREYPGHTIEIVSAYRSPPYGVKNSKHFHGRAIDLRVRDVPLTEVRDFLWSTHENVGVGYYRGGQNFVHVDYRPGYKKIAWTSPHKGASYRYHPKWAREITAQLMIDHADAQ